MPQGGIDQGESPYAAAIRELREETGVVAEDVELLAESRDWLDYELPAELVGRIWNGRFRGQRQRWFLFRLLVGDDAIDIDSHETREFRCWDWLPPSRLRQVVVPFKRHVYERLFEEFGPWLAEQEVLPRPAADPTLEAMTTGQ